MTTDSNALRVNFLLAVFFLVYLCVLDALFVLRMNEQKSIINGLGGAIVLMPFIGASVTFFMLRKSTSFKKRILLSFLSFSSLSLIGFIEYLWVATHFHTMIGGRL